MRRESAAVEAVLDTAAAGVMLLVVAGGTLTVIVVEVDARRHGGL
jgi:hypothetical protein